MSGDILPNPPSGPNRIDYKALVDATILGSYEDVPPGAGFRLFVERDEPYAAANHGPDPDTAVQDAGTSPLAVAEPPQPRCYDSYIFTRSTSDRGGWWHEWRLDALDQAGMPVALCGAATARPGEVSRGVIKYGMFFQFTCLELLPDGMGPDADPYWSLDSPPTVVQARGFNLGKVVGVHWPWDGFRVSE